jgi:hypothetical protein
MRLKKIPDDFSSIKILERVIIRQNCRKISAGPDMAPVF